MSNTIALIPAYRPATLLIDLIRQLTQADIEVVIVDDGSGPDSRPIFTACQTHATLLAHTVNQGKGAALKTGLSHILTHADHATIITLDADGQHTVRDALRVAKQADEHPGALVLGCRSFQHDVPLRSQVGNTLTRHVFSLFTGRNVTDTQTGLRAFSSTLIPFLLAIDGERYEYEMNVLLACTRQAIPLQEVPIETLYFDRNAGSHFNAVKDSLRIYGELLKFAASSLIAFGIDYGVYALLVMSIGSWGAWSLPLANVLARMASASANYTFNRNYVFKDKRASMRSLLQYALLATFILVFNTVQLSALVNGLGMDRYLAKLLTELTFFILSWWSQRRLIFVKKEGIEASTMRKAHS